MDKKILEEYIDACELIKETEEDIRRLEERNSTLRQDSVEGSNPEFPYQKKHFHIEGFKGSMGLDNKIIREKALLEERKANAESIKLQVQQFLNAAPMRMQRIIRMKYIEGKSWENIAKTMGKKATPDSVRKELDRFLKEN